MTDIINFLKTISIFKNLNSNSIKEVADKIEQRVYPKGTFYIHKGEIGHEIYFVLSGTLHVTLRNLDSKEFIIKTLGYGDFFGELSMYGNNRRASNVKNISKCELLQIQKENFVELADKHPMIMKNLLSVITDIVAETDELLFNILFKDARQQIISLIVNLAKNAQRNKNGLKSINRISVTDISNMTRVGRQTTSLIINDLENSGFIERDKKKIILLHDNIENCD